MNDKFLITRHESTTIPTWILYNSELDHFDVRLWGIFAASDSTNELSYSKLSDYFNCSTRTILRSIKRLEIAGAIAIQRDKGKQNHYALWPIIPAGSDSGVTTTSDSGVTSDTGVTTLSDDSEVSPYILNNTCTFEKVQDDFSEKVQSRTYQKNQYTDEFNALWKLYPRKSNKPGAYKKYLITLNKGVTHASLLSAVIAYAKEKDGTDEKYVLHGSTFFGPDERWNDFADEEIDPKEQEYNSLSAVIYDQWDAAGSWIDPDTDEECLQNPTIHGYNRPRGAENAFVASDGSLYNLDASGNRVKPDYWGRSQS